MTTTPQRLLVHDTADLLALMPYLLGYQPRERMVIALLDQRRIALAAAFELASFDRPDEAREALLSVTDQYPDALVLLAAHSSDTRLAEDCLALCEVWLGCERVLDSVHVGPRQWRSRIDGECGYACELASSRVAAEAVLAGLSSLDDRDEVVRQVAGPVGLDTSEFEGFASDFERDVPDLDRVLSWVRGAGGRPGLGPALLARLAVSVGHVEVRDGVFLAMDARHREDHLALWRQVVAATPERWALGPVLMLGCASWVAGSGALMVACIERALRLDPDNRLAQLLSQVNRQALHPSVWEQVRADCIFGVPCPSSGAVLAGATR